MDSDKVLNTDTSRMNFMYNRISMPRACLASWLHLPEFIDAINSLLDRRIRITNKEVFDICEKIMNEKEFDDEARMKYYYSRLKRGLNHLRRATESASTSESERTSS